ncbi:MAG TPA: pyridoxal-phosphate dependent enzyme [Longimicrobium sp.]|nr:pyridoxal-phosphate dependent enzyme [Longimicrobium sp.]
MATAVPLLGRNFAEMRCLRCDALHPASIDAYLCPACGRGDGGDAGILDAEYDYAAIRAELERGSENWRRGVFRWSALLPVAAPGTCALTAGGTPLIPAPRLARRLGLRELWLKDESANPTRCLKDRATAVALALAAARGMNRLFCASAGNAAISLAGFCAHAGAECHVWVPARVSEQQLAWLYRFGATVHVSPGDYDAAYDEAEAVGHRRGWYSRNCAFNPFLVEGKKTVAFEMAEQLGGVPDLVVAPVGDGCTLAAIGKGFRELREVGRTDALPRLLGVQAEGVQPLVARLHGAATAPEGSTRAASIAVGRPRNGARLMRELRTAGGTLLAIPDTETDAAAATLAREAGMACELTSATGLAGLARLAESESLEGKTAVIVITGGRVD